MRAADQDPVFKEIFYTSFSKLRDSKQKVDHYDDHYFHLADRIVKLDYGKVEFDKT